MHKLASLLFAIGLAALLIGLAAQLPLGMTPMVVGQAILEQAPGETGSANIVTSVVLAYRGIDTLGELAILFAAATVAGLVLAPSIHAESRLRAKPRHDAGLVLRAGSDLLFPLLLSVGFYIVLHGHLTPGGGFQGGVVLAAAFFVSFLARPARQPSHVGIVLIEALAGASFIGIGLAALLGGGAFLQPVLDKGTLGQLVSAGSLPLLYLAVGLKVGAELSGLLAHLAE
ncbi:MAG: sodium:proton antiporter [Thiobacillus sp.]|nr:sodium:proton antiporter [Thiobacillus sp.]